MSKKIKTIFYIICVLYIILILTGWYGLFVIIKNFGLNILLQNTNWIYQITIVILLFFLFKKNVKALYFSLISSIFWLSTMAGFGVLDYGILGSIKSIFNNFFAGYYQPFLLKFSIWLITLFSIIGICFHFYDEYCKKIKNSMKD
ncbi:hypothetical protein [Francisella philomiragia]|uniref:hypothetical protein n=1 Tax=Francisella philomiragia TaxID=28110 RepID=UPI002242C73E|nr:hypothetical protein [Francisella philomiragia]